MDKKEREAYGEFVKNALEKAVKHTKGAGQLSKDDYIILHSKDGYSHAINAQRIKHIYDRHGNDAIEAAAVRWH